MEKRLSFKLCYTCWVSKNIDKFYDSDQRCKDCKKKRLRTPRAQYDWEQEQKPLEDRMKVCLICCEEKSILVFSRNGDKYKSPCLDCKSGHQREYVSKRGKLSDSQRLNYNRLMREYNSRRRQSDPEYSDTLNSYRRKRNSMKKNQEYTLPENFFLDLLDTYGEVCMHPGCSETDNLEYDHIIPVNWGRICDWSVLNAQVLCASHNRSKQDKYSMDFRPMEIPIGDEMPAGDFDIRDLLL